MKYLYCDSCSLITYYQDGLLGSLSQYKGYFYISETQINGELLYPNELGPLVRQSITVILEDREEIIEKTKELTSSQSRLSRFDCLSLAYAILDGYCLVTDDKALIKKCNSFGVEVKTSKQIKEEFCLEVIGMKK